MLLTMSECKVLDEITENMGLSNLVSVLELAGEREKAG